MESASLNLVEVGNKAKSKWELYRLLTVEGGLYLPPEDQTNMEFISDIFFNEKKVRKEKSFNDNFIYSGLTFKWCESLPNTSCFGTPFKWSH